MKLSLAIEVVTKFDSDANLLLDNKEIDALRLVIESANLQEKMRAEGCLFFTALLPGETKE